MDLRWPDDEAWAALAGPLRAVLEPAIARLALRPTELPPVVEARAGEVGLTPRGIALDRALLGPGTRHPLDEAWAAAHPAVASLAPDRWRRAAGLVLEGIAFAGLQEEIGAPLPRTWWTLGPAAEAVDRAAPELGWLWPEAADLLLHPEVGLSAAPRRGAWLVRWARQAGRDWPAGERPALDDDDWAAFGAWVDDLGHGPAAGCPVPLTRGGARELPDPSDGGTLDAAPLSFVRLRLDVDAGGTVVDWGHGRTALLPGEHREFLVPARSGGAIPLARQPVLPLGTWRLAGGTFGDRPGAARGIDLDLRADGHIDIVFADAFAGPPTPYLLGLARTVGVSGTGRGRYHLVRADGPGRGALRFDALSPDLLTVHPRMGGRFALPAETFLEPVRRSLDAMSGVDWEFSTEGDTLRLEAPLFGTPTVLRLERPES
ncbi:MAG: hypothetical protein D6798_10210 [Deltaproteobacteria bacterium]|nr:MAG: hypothetical protein D6798_10210 [Deltaproteobacteria bacterium]